MISFASSELNVNQVGTAGEYLVTTMLLIAGYDAHRVDTVGYDIILMLEDGTAVRIDVKTKVELQDYYQFTIKKGKKTNFRGYESSDCDLLAFVCLEQAVVKFVSADSCVGKSAYSITKDQFEATDFLTSLEEAIDSLYQ